MDPPRQRPPSSSTARFQSLLRNLDSHASSASSSTTSPIYHREAGIRPRSLRTPPQFRTPVGSSMSDISPIRRTLSARRAEHIRVEQRLATLPPLQSDISFETAFETDSEVGLAVESTAEKSDFQHWTTSHVEWCCRQLSEILQDSTATPYVERSAILGKVIPDTKFRLDVVLSPQPESFHPDLLDQMSIAGRAIVQEIDSTFKPYFTAYIAPAYNAQSYDERRGDRPVTADIFLGIKPNSVAPGPHEGQDRWLWSTQETFVFSDDFTFWKAKLPPISELLKDRSIKERDCFTLVLRLQTPATFPSTVNSSEKRLVDRNLLTGLRSLLDHANTGDIKLVCLEREDLPQLIPGKSPGSSTAASTQIRYRKRILYAHSSIIKHRSEYLADWIRFSSTEDSGPPSSRHPAASSSDRPTHTVTCLDVDFATMYWFLHFLYTGELDFRDGEDVTESSAFHIESLDPEIAQELVSDVANGNPWEWRSLSIKDDGTMEVVRRTEPTRIKSESPEGSNRSFLSANSSHSAGPSASTSTATRAKMNTASYERIERAIQHLDIRRRSPSASSSATLQAESLLRTRSSPTTPHTPSSIRPKHMSDPHSHPTGPMPPASAFAIYALAHRYQLDELCRLAQNHLLAHLKPESSCSLLLASFRFQALHVAVEDYVIAHWETVQSSPEFLKAIQDIANGSWGSDGGSCLHSLFGRFQKTPVSLRS